MTETDDKFVVAARIRPMYSSMDVFPLKDVNKRVTELKSKAEREKDRGAKSILFKDGNTLKIIDTENESAERTFTFSHVFWSADGFTRSDDGTLKPDSDTSQFADQQAVYKELGCNMLDACMEGYNGCLLTYGQTGSGKTFTVTGDGINKGLLTMFADDMFQRLEDLQKQQTNYQVTISMCEIYMEKLKDLFLSPSQGSNEMRIRDHPKLGTYIQGLSVKPVNGAVDFKRLFEQGKNNRLVAATQMNATSSRSHMLVFINLRHRSQGITTEAKVVVADLAGSESQRQTGTTGQQLMEGMSINRSMSALQSVISALTQRSQGKKKVVVPFRDSTLTRILKDFLIGNSRNVMLINLSPADYNYDNSLSSLRFGSAVMKVSIKPEKNQYSHDVKVRELKEMIEGLKTSGDHEDKDAEDKAKNQALQDLEERLQQLEKEEEIISMPWWKKTTLFSTQKEEDLEKQREEDKLKFPYFWNLNEDQSISGTILHFLKKGRATVGLSESNPEIVLQGLGVEAQHCELIDRGGKIYIIPIAKTTMVNGRLVTLETELQHNDRVWFGPSDLYVFNDPGQKKPHLNRPTFDHAQQEIVLNTTYISGLEVNLKDDLELQDRMLDLVPKVIEVTAMAKLFKKHVRFEVVLISAKARGLREGKSKEEVRMVSLQEDGSDGNDWLWDVDKFQFRYMLMTEMYQAFASGSKDWDKPQYKDPFWEAKDAEKLLGVCSFNLCMLVCGQDMVTEDIVDYMGKAVGQLNVQCMQCDPMYKPLEDDQCIFMEPELMQGQPLYLSLHVDSASGLQANIDMSYCRYKFFDDKNFTQTSAIGGTLNPQYNNVKKIHVSMVSIELSNYFKNESLLIEVFGKMKQEELTGLAAGVVLATNEEISDPKPSGTESGPVKSDDTGKKELQFMSQRMRRQEHAQDSLVIQTHHPERLNAQRDPTPQAKSGPHMGSDTQPRAVKTKDEENLRIKQLAQENQQEDERLRERIYRYLRQRGQEGHTAIRIEDVVALLEGLPPPGRPVETSAEMSGQQSKACILQ